MTTKHFSSPLGGLRAMEADLLESPTPPKTPRRLPLDRIIVCPGVFQQRDENRDEYQRERHIHELIVAIAQQSVLEPLTIWWGGNGFYLVDGHHRLEAYRRSSVAQPIPVEVFQGTPKEALAKSASGNSHDKLPMTAQEKMNAALRLTLCTDLSLPQVVKATATSASSVKNIRRTVKALVEREHTKEELSGMTWKEVDALSKGNKVKTFDIDKVTRERAEAFKKAILRAVGPSQLHYCADALVLAISELDSDLLESMECSEHWPVREEPELLDGFSDEPRDPEPDY